MTFCSYFLHDVISKKLLIKISEFVVKKNTDKQDSGVEAEAKKEEGRIRKLFFFIQLTHIVNIQH